MAGSRRHTVQASPNLTQMIENAQHGEARTPISASSSAESAMPAIKLSDACTNFTDQLPSDYVVYAGGAYQGKTTGGSPQVAHSTGRFDVYVNVPGKPVVLALGAYEPSAWHIKAAPTTRIVGVLVSGYHTQSIVEMPPNTPALSISYDSKSPCGYFYVSRDSASRAAVTIRRILGRAAESYSLASDGKIDIGWSPTARSASATPQGQTPPQPSTTIERRIDQNGRVIYSEKR